MYIVSFHHCLKLSHCENIFSDRPVGALISPSESLFVPPFVPSSYSALPSLFSLLSEWLVLHTAIAAAALPLTTSPPLSHPRSSYSQRCFSLPLISPAALFDELNRIISPRSHLRLRAHYSSTMGPTLWNHLITIRA